MITTRLSYLLSALLVMMAVGFYATISPVFAMQISPYKGLVNDFAEIISDDTEQKLENDLTSIATSTNGAEVAVVTLSSLEGDVIENVAQQYFDTWKIGKANKDNGALLLIAVEEREVRIQTGYGTETVLTDSTAGTIIRNDITPAFKAGDYDTGITQGVTRITQYLQNPDDIPDTADASTNYSSSSSDLNPGLIAFILYFGFTLGISGLTYAAAFLGRSKAWWPGGLIGLALGFLIGNVTGGVAFGLFGLFLDYLLSKNYTNWNLEKKTTSWRETMGGFYSSSGGGSSSSGGSGFSSFGGGSSGGGGASGKW